jgi:hypothetical protein
VSHTRHFETEDVTFHFNPDLSGEVGIVTKGGQISVPGQVLALFVFGVIYDRIIYKVEMFNPRGALRWLLSDCNPWPRA